MQYGEPSKILTGFSLIVFTKSRLNFTPEKLHSEGKANKLQTLPATNKVPVRELKLNSFKSINIIWVPIINFACSRSRQRIQFLLMDKVKYDTIFNYYHSLIIQFLLICILNQHIRKERNERFSSFINYKVNRIIKLDICSCPYSGFGLTAEC